MDSSLVIGIGGIVIATVISWIVKNIANKVKDSASIKDIENIQDDIKDNGEKDHEARKEIWIEIREMQQRLTKIETKMEK